MLHLISRLERCSFMWFFSKKKIKKRRVWMVIWVYLYFGLLEKKTTSHNFHWHEEMVQQRADSSIITERCHDMSDLVAFRWLPFPLILDEKCQIVMLFFFKKKIVFFVLWWRRRRKENMKSRLLQSKERATDKVEPTWKQSGFRKLIVGMALRKSWEYRDGWAN